MEDERRVSRGRRGGRPNPSMQQELPQEPSSGGFANCCTTLLKVLVLFSFVPLTFSVPFGFKYAVSYIDDKVSYFVYLWVVYGIVWVYLSWQKRSLHTWESFLTQFLKYLLFSMGSFAMLGAFNFMDPATKQVSLILWMSIATLVYLIFLYYDNTDYKLLQKQEEEKEKRETEEWNKLTQKPSKSSKKKEKST